MEKFNSQPLVTIFIPTVGRLDFLKASLLSAQKQTYKNLEILVGDNASGDGSAELIAEMAQEDSRIVSYRLEQRVSMPENWQRGLEQAIGQYFTILGDDDLLNPDFVQACLEPFWQHHNLQAVAGLYEVIDADNHLQTEMTQLRKKVCFLHGLGLKQLSATQHPGGTPPIMACLLKTEWARQFGFRTEAGLAADVDLFWRAAASSYQIFFLDQVIAQYRVSQSAMSAARGLELNMDTIWVTGDLAKHYPQLSQNVFFQNLRKLSIWGVLNCLMESGETAHAQQLLTQYKQELSLKQAVKYQLKIMIYNFNIGKESLHFFRKLRKQLFKQSY